jgi:polyhydroxybutyrate depolymerase
LRRDAVASRSFYDDVTMSTAIASPRAALQQTTIATLVGAVLIGAWGCDVGQPLDAADATDATDATDAGAAAAEDGVTPPVPGEDAGAAAATDDAGTTMPPAADAGHAMTPTTACGTSAPSGGAWTVEHDGQTRTFHVRLPDGHDNTTPLPVVLSFHGRAVNAASQEATSRFTALGSQEGFIVVYPQGLGSLPTWNAGVCCSDGLQDVYDLGFVDALLDRLESDLCIDTSRVYANGLSAGGFMTYALACERSERFAAVASVAGMTGMFPCNPEREIPVFHFHGTDDGVVSYTGTGGLTVMSVDNNMASWASRNGCDAQPSVFLQDDDVTCEQWTGCDAQSEVRLCTIDGGGHQWPGGVAVPLLGPLSDTIDATQMMWSFCRDFSLPAP